MKKLFAVFAVVSFTTGCAVAPPDADGKSMHSTHFIAGKTPRQVLESIEQQPGCNRWVTPQGRYYEEDKTFKVTTYMLAYGLYPTTIVNDVFKGRPVEGGTQVDLYTRQQRETPEAFEYINRANTGSCD